MEGDSVELTLTLSRSLPTPLTVQLEYLSQSAKISKLLVIITIVYVYVPYKGVCNDNEL